MSRSDPYSHLDPALRRLADDALDLWGDRQVRHAALDAILIAFDRDNDADLERALRRVDDAIVVGLAALGLPRGTISSLRFESRNRRWQGLKEPTCDLILNAGPIRYAIRTLQVSDEVFRTWLHESIHARQPFARPSGLNDPFVGYEEGLAEGLARVVMQRAGIEFIGQSYNHYVAAYETLAQALTDWTQRSISAEALWRAIWREPPGAIRNSFLEHVTTVAGQPFTRRQRMTVQLRADTLFDRGRGADMIIDRENLIDRWIQALNGYDET